MAASSKSTIHGCAQKASFCPRPSLVCDGLCQETCRKDTPHSTLTCRLVGNRCRHASSPALQSCPGGGTGTARCRVDHPQCPRATSCESNNSVSKKPRVDVLLQTPPGRCGPNVILCLNVSVDRIVVAVEYAQGYSERPRSRTVECMVHRGPPGVRGRRKGHGSSHSRECGRTAHPKQPAFPFSAPQPGLQTSDEQCQLYVPGIERSFSSQRAAWLRALATG